jgi:acyl carrier protein
LFNIWGLSGDFSEGMSVNHVLQNHVSEAPCGEVEIAIAQIWRDVLKSERIGRDDNFFELGGDSLIAMKLTEIVASKLMIEVSVVELFQNPSIRELALIVSDSRAS